MHRKYTTHAVFSSVRPVFLYLFLQRVILKEKPDCKREKYEDITEYQCKELMCFQLSASGDLILKNEYIVSPICLKPAACIWFSGAV